MGNTRLVRLPKDIEDRNCCGKEDFISVDCHGNSKPVLSRSGIIGMYKCLVQFYQSYLALKLNIPKFIMHCLYLAIRMKE
jgi:hypothetical protein